MADAHKGVEPLLRKSAFDLKKFMIFSLASARSVNQFSLRHSSRKRSLKLSNRVTADAARCNHRSRS
jgi:hypothetical protein